MLSIEAEARRIRAGVGEFARFRLSGRGGKKLQPWRTELGQQWHQRLQTEWQPEGGLVEHPVKGTLNVDGWTIELEGRLDYWLPAASPAVFREIKTVSVPLPAAAPALRARYPQHFLQGAAYLRLLQAAGHRAKGSLVLLEIATGLRQEVALEAEDLDSFAGHCRQVIRFFELGRQAGGRRHRFGLRSLRDCARPGQLELLEQLEQSSLAHPVIALEAPTGFGKTRLLLEHALSHLREGRWDRVIYLTGKSTGQVQVMKELDNLQGSPPLPPVYRMRNRREHTAICRVPGCNALTCGEPPARAPLPTPDEFACLAEPTLQSWQTLENLTAPGTCCAYQVSQDMLCHADVWVADYNYLFSASASSLFRDVANFNPQRTVLLIDEAHNLPDRVTSALSIELAAADLRNLAYLFQSTGGQQGDRRLLLSLADFLQSKDIKRDPVEAAWRLEDDLIGFFERERNMGWLLSDIPLPELETWEALRRARQLFENPALSPVLVPLSDGRCRLEPLRIAPWIAPLLEPFHRTYLFSATMQPVAALLEELGLPTGSTPVLTSSGFWQADQFNVTMDAGVSTRLRDRTRDAAAIASRIGDFAESGRGPCAVFFPSYRFAETIATLVGDTHPHLRGQLQARGGDLAEREYFAEHAPRQADILYLVLGGSFAEGIDAFGGQIENVVVVGPALPEMDDSIRLRMESYPGNDPEQAFHAICRIPAMRRVNQALGRFVRDPGHRVRVLLLDRRFAEPAYYELLHPLLRPPAGQ